MHRDRSRLIVVLMIVGVLAMAILAVAQVMHAKQTRLSLVNEHRLHVQQVEALFWKEVGR